MHAIVHAADLQDRDGGALVMATLFGLYPFLLTTHRAVGTRLSEPRKGPSPRYRHHGCEGKSSILPCDGGAILRAIHLTTLVWDLDAKLEKLSIDSRRSPQRVGEAHLADQPAIFQRHRWSAAAAARFPAPIRSEARAVPSYNSVRLNDRKHTTSLSIYPETLCGIA